MRKIYILSFILLILAGSATAQKHNAVKEKATSGVTLDTTTWLDAARNRQIPVALYMSKAANAHKKQRVIIVNHGYGQNYPGSYLTYSYLCNYFASKGFFVVSIQHELPADSLIPDGIPQIVRRPFWERGADNIRFVIQELKRTRPYLDFKHMTLIGHSNGGDMAALFPQKYPGMVDKIITLDNRRMALPRTKHPKVYSLRSSDQPADEGVLPTVQEQQALGITIIKLPDTIHNDMDDGGNERQRKEIRDYIAGFLKE